MKLSLTFLLTLACTVYSYSQVFVSGQVVAQEDKEPLPFATVYLSQEDGEGKLNGSVADVDGNFRIETAPGQYTLKVSYLGQELYEADLDLTTNLELGVISVSKVQELDEVTVEASKEVIDRRIDRLVFNVENSTKSSEGDALEVLRVTPGVRVQNDRIRMIGKSALSVMVNGKIIRLAEEDLGNFLKSIPSEDIKSIEVITTPPAKYEAEGNSGLINIQLKTTKKDSWNALVRAYYRQRTRGTYSTLGSYNYNKNKWGVSATLNFADGIWHADQDVTTFFPDARWSTTAPFNAEIDRVNGRFSLTHDLSNRVKMGFQYIYNESSYLQDNDPFTPITENSTGNIISFLRSNTILASDPRFNSGNFYTSFDLDSMGRNITINLDYFTYTNDDRKSYDGTSVDEVASLTEYFQGLNINKQDIENYSGKIDVEYPIGRVNLSFGGKITSTVSNNVIQLFNSGVVESPVGEFDLAQTDFEYEENIQALYASFNRNLNDKWKIQGGLRLELTQTATFSNGAQTNTNDYNRLFPTLYFAYFPNQDATVTLSYSRRIQRPQFLDLNPNIFFLNPFVSVEGNPTLQPAFIDNFEIANSYKNLETKVYYSVEDNLFAQVPLPDSETNITRFTNENYINTQRFGITENYMWEPFSWFTSNNSVDVNYTYSEFDLEELSQAQEGFNARISTNNDFRLLEDKSMIVSVNYWYSFAGIDGIYDIEPMSSVSVGVNKYWMDRKINLSIRANDIFKRQIQRLSTITNNIRQNERYYYDSRSLQVTFSYRFGNDKIRVRRNSSGNEAERRRTGN